MSRARILVVDDEVGMLEVCADTLKRRKDTEIVTESDSRRAAELIASETYDLIILDIRMPSPGGVELLRSARERDPTVAVLMITAFPSVETAVECMKLGAADYATKPFIPEDLVSTVERLLESRRLKEENRLLSKHIEGAYRAADIIGESAVIRDVLETVGRVAESDADVVILGETGTGKELVAHALHRQSARGGNRFVPVDCGAIPDELLEAEFFGHERGAFTGAHERSLGLLEFADRGTFFLDEVGELPPRLQTKLLRALQERRFRRVGGTREIEVDVRVIAATARDLEKEVEAQRFRKELYYRINVARIELPPLRERAGDIPLLTAHYVARYATEMGRGQVEAEPELLEVLRQYPWPGNVRELQNVVKRTLAMTRGPGIAVDDLPDEIVVGARAPPEPGRAGFFDLRERRNAAFEREYLTQLLENHRGDVVAAARAAALPRGTLYRLLKKHDIKPMEYRS
ncbi:MAG: sigma-54-dependent transcriptional regulator [Planctomycetota bacterium]|jgi:DNA-binding NtrC family response regulator